MNKLLLAGLTGLVLIGGFAQAEGRIYGSRGEFGSCRSTVEWNKNRLQGAHNALGRWIGYAEKDLEGYKNGQKKYDDVNHMWAIQEQIKNKNYSPYRYNKRQYLNHVKKIFQRDCGGFLKKDRDIAAKTAGCRIHQWRIVEEMMTNQYFVKNWKTIGAYFPGYYDYRTPTGYAIP